MPLKSNDVEAALKKKGFQRDDGDHKFFYLYHLGKRTTIRTKISHGRSHDIDDSLISKMYKQLKFKTKETFLQYVECKVTYEEYIKDLETEKLL
jgi:predicted RNA binding protein YcfA (HicA-like mRNA interferase family)